MCHVSLVRQSFQVQELMSLLNHEFLHKIAESFCGFDKPKTKTNSKCRSYVVGKDYREIPDELPDLIPALHFLRFFINLRESYLTPVEGAEF